MNLTKREELETYIAAHKEKTVKEHWYIIELEFPWEQCLSIRSILGHNKYFKTTDDLKGQAKELVEQSIKTKQTLSSGYFTAYYDHYGVKLAYTPFEVTSHNI